tara:strand:- start:43741 stop:45243 length:1503 start_codon:yes stop_codon:yes gene_type:complete
MTNIWGRVGGGAGAITLALLLSLWVFLANGGATFYFDTFDYVERGHQLLSLLGLELAPLHDMTVIPSTTSEEIAPGGNVETVDGSRSMVFSLLSGIFFWLGAVDGLVAMNAILAVGTIWLACRLAMRGIEDAPRPSSITLVAVGLASLGSLPFYVAFLMPDILSPILLAVTALLSAYAPKMRAWELFLVTSLGSLAITVSMSHLATGLILLPIVVLGAIAFRGPRRWLAPTLMLVVVLAGIGEQAFLRLAAKQVEDAEVIYRPFLTAQLIQDGPGLAYLSEQCPTEPEPTCALLDALSVSDDLERFSATNISFSSNPSNGSFQLMAADDQVQVAQQQFQFFIDVLLNRPIETSLSFADNVLRQLTLNSVNMTLQTDEIVNRGNGATGMAWGDFGPGRLTDDTRWLAVADRVQSLLYALAAVSVLGFLASGRLPRPVATFVIMILIGIIVNAFVSGVLSQPANRYGARVIWLLPVAAVIAGAVFISRRRVDGESTDDLSVV